MGRLEEVRGGPHPLDLLVGCAGEHHVEAAASRNRVDNKTGQRVTWRTTLTRLPRQVNVDANNVRLR